MLKEVPAYRNFSMFKRSTMVLFIFIVHLLSCATASSESAGLNPEHPRFLSLATEHRESAQPIALVYLPRSKDNNVNWHVRCNWTSEFEATGTLEEKANIVTIPLPQVKAGKWEVVFFLVDKDGLLIYTESKILTKGKSRASVWIDSWGGIVLGTGITLSVFAIQEILRGWFRMRQDKRVCCATHMLFRQELARCVDDDIHTISLPDWLDSPSTSDFREALADRKLLKLTLELRDLTEQWTHGHIDRESAIKRLNNMENL